MEQTCYAAFIIFRDRERENSFDKSPLNSGVFLFWFFCQKSTMLLLRSRRQWVSTISCYHCFLIMRCTHCAPKMRLEIGLVYLKPPWTNQDWGVVSEGRNIIWNFFPQNNAVLKWSDIGCMLRYIMPCQLCCQHLNKTFCFFVHKFGTSYHQHILSVNVCTIWQLL